MPSPKTVGERSEAVILARLLLAGRVVLQPFGDNQRYDLVMDEDGKFTRIQCKTGRVRNGVVKFNACSSHYHRGKGWSDYKGQVELFGVYVPELDKVYFVPVDEAGSHMVHLRLEPPKNGQAKGVRLASDYEFSPT
jgi:hypothetical protein